MKRTTQIFVQDLSQVQVFTRLDLFKDETISITDTIQDVRDIAKVFTQFSQSFSIPASKTNNKLFKHFYNADITDGFDARIFVEARIEINNIPFKKGFVKLEGVDLKNDRPFAYKITFFGETVILKNIIGDDKLSDLSDLDTLSQKYISENDGTNDGIKEFLLKDSSNAANDLIVPLLTHSQRLFYNSAQNVANSGNLYYVSSSNKHGVRWDNLKYAIRVQRIIEAIEAKYSQITFSNDFFDDSNPSFFNLFMWLHRKKGYLEGATSESTTPSLVSGWAVGGDEVASFLNASTLTLTTEDSVIISAIRFKIVNASATFNLEIKKDGSTIRVQSVASGNSTITLSSSEIQKGSSYQVFVTTSTSITVGFSWEIDFSEPEAGSNTGIFNCPSSGTITITAVTEFVITQQIPDMGVIDFLTGLFKMFNLTAFVEQDGTIYVDTLDEFYKDKESSGNPYTIDEFVDSTQNTSDSALPYREVKLTYKDTGTLLAKQHNQAFGLVWGEEEYNKSSENFDNKPDTNLAGNIYKVEAPFGHMKFERLLNLNDDTTTVIQWGYSADDNFDTTTGDYDAYIGEPVLFYPVYTSVSANPISFVYDLDPSNGTFNNVRQLTGSVNMPSNSISFDPTATNGKKNINFKNEQNEYAIGPDVGNAFLFTDTLFSQYYTTYITQTFTRSNRIIKLKAFLPLKILLNYTLADKFIYKGRKHQINSITTNLNTGESQIELLNTVIE